MLKKSFASNVEVSANVAAVAGMFGIGADRDRPVVVFDNLELNIEQGQVVYVTGGSGAGKSLLLKLLKQKMIDEPLGPGGERDYGCGCVDLDEIEMPKGKPLVDCFNGLPLTDVLGFLASAGLSDAFAILRSSEQLSDGQRYRFRLALALSRRPRVVFIDEFCAALDRVTAAVVAYNVRKFADKLDTTFIAATSPDDLLEDLSPDVVVIKHLGSNCDVYYPRRQRAATA